MGIQWFNIATIMIKSILISAVVAVAFTNPEAKADPQYSLGSLGALGYTGGLYNAYNGLNRGIYTTGLGAYNTLGAYNGLRTYNGLTGYNGLYSTGYYGGYRGKRSADAEAEPEAQCASYGCLGYNGYTNLGYNSYANLGYARAGYAGLNGLRSYAPVSPYYSYQ